MRYAFAILLALHGLIHLMGFVKSFYLTDINIQVLGISKPIGSFWLIVFILFVILSSQFLTHKKWFYVAFMVVFCVSNSNYFDMGRGQIRNYCQYHYSFS